MIEATFTTKVILDEVKKLQYLYGLKYEIRYEEERACGDFTESVAEHIYAMHILADYFLQLEDPEGKWDHNKIRRMITWHDIDEIETGDIIGWKKTQADKDREAAAMEVLVTKLPTVLQGNIASAVREYEARETMEAKFVKAIDKIEPLFHLYNEDGKKLCQKIGLTFADSDRIKTPYIEPFPIMTQFKTVIQAKMVADHYFVD